jgi:NAD(P)-dependent dehydrogenase (short-subunit alcohol dehydrogenase family)
MDGTPVALVTGGAQGIGRATAQTLLEAGYRVVIADIDREAGVELVAALAADDAVRFVVADIAQEAAVTDLVGAAVAAYGRLDCLVNNAGISCNRPLAELSLADWQRVIGVNLTGAMLCSKYAAPHLAEAGGSIINIVSTRAHMSEAHTEAYSASKGGLLALTHALAISLGPAVRVNCVSPGWIDVSAWRKGTQRGDRLRPADHAQHPAGRVGRPEDVAELIRYLASPAAAFITGQEFIIDGGMTRKMIYVD